MNFSNIFLILILLNFSALFFFNKVANFFNLYDYPDGKRKLHSEPVPLLGGVLFIINFIFYIILSKNMSADYYYIILCSFVFALVGIIDDKLNIKSYLKLFILLIVLLSFFLINNKYLINYITIYNKQFYFSTYYSLFFTTLCILLFVNALNLFDGIDLQSSLYVLFLLIVLLFKKEFVEVIAVALITLIFIIYLNFKKKTFLGYGGIFFLGSLISLIIIFNYKFNKNINIEEIFILMILPGIDMFRLFIDRILARKDPFSPDRQHFHHLLLKFYGYKKTIFLTIALCSLPYIFSIFFQQYYVILFFLFLYFILISFLKKKSSRF